MGGNQSKAADGDKTQVAESSCEHCRKLNLSDVKPETVSRTSRAAARGSLKVLLIGKTGHGKSATGNSILGRKEFKASTSTSSETKKVRGAWTEHKDILVVDGPGLADTCLTPKESKKKACTDMAKALSICNGGVHAFLLVIRFGSKFTAEEKTAFSDLETIFGTNYLKERGIIILTRGDDFEANMKDEGHPNKSFDDWCTDQNEELFKKCPRIILFNNRSECEQVKNNQRNQLFQLADQLRQEKGLYTTKHFKIFADVRKDFQRDIPILNESIQKQINLLVAEFKCVSKMPNLDSLEHLQTRITTLNEKLKPIKDTEDESTEQLMDTLKKIQNITQNLEAAIKENTESVESLVEELMRQREIVKGISKASWKNMFSTLAEILKNGLKKLLNWCCILSFTAQKYKEQAEKNGASAETCDVPADRNDVPAEIKRHLQSLPGDYRTMSQITAASAIKPLHFILIGKTGHGKSATGNSILGRKEFTSSASTSLKTKTVEVAWADHNYYDIKVVDVPGLQETYLSLARHKEAACDNMAQAMKLCDQGVHAFVLVIRFGTSFTHGERKTLTDLETIFGKCYLKNHGIILITGGDKFPAEMEIEDTPEKSFKEWWQEQDEDLFKECSPRIVLFNNTTISEQILTDQRNELFQHAEKLSKERGLYTLRHFQMHADLRQEMIKQYNLPLLEEVVQKKLNLLAAEVKRISIKTTLGVLEHLQTRIHILRRELMDKNRCDKSWIEIIQHLGEMLNTADKLERAIRVKNTKDIALYVNELHSQEEKVKYLM